MYTHDIRTIWKVIVINVLIVISWTFLVTPHSFRVLITIEQGIAVGWIQTPFKAILNLVDHQGQRVGVPFKTLATKLFSTPSFLSSLTVC